MAQKKARQVYSEKTVRRKTTYVGVYARKAVNRKDGNKLDICYDISYKVDGKKVWEKVGWKSEGYSALLAKDVRGERIRAIRHGEELPQQRQRPPCIKDLWEKYKKWAETNKTRGGADDISRWNCHIKERFENKRLDEISSFDLEKFKADLTSKELSPSSVKHCLVLIRQMYNKAISWGLYKGENPIRGVKLPTPANQRTRFLSHEEANALLEKLKQNTRIKSRVEYLDDPQLHDMALLSLHTGMRAGEIFALKGYDIDLTNTIITIRDPKNKSTRHAYMTSRVRGMLMNRIPNKPDDLIFKDIHGKQIFSISNRFTSIVTDLGLNKGVTDTRQMVTFHTLRHTFASWLAIRGETLQTIGDLLGHKDLAMTRRYSHLSPDHKRRAVMALESEMNGETKAEETETQSA
ncbi:MAG: site-specific integrase [Syntrophales bacterium]|nr:site-specific integrase [Syntrophales bacterium]